MSKKTYTDVVRFKRRIFAKLDSGMTKILVAQVGELLDIRLPASFDLRDSLARHTEIEL